MEIKREYLQKYIHNIAIDQLMADYQSKGYQVSVREKIGNYHPDLVARKGDEVVVVEIKAGKLTPDKRRQLSDIGDFVRTHQNYKFLVVLATPPKPKAIDIPNLEHLLFEHLIDNFPDDLDSLSSHTRITDVPDTTVDEVTVAEDGSIIAKGNGTVEVELEYGSANDDRAVTEDVFPFNFEVTLQYNQNQELVLVNAKTIEIDTSSFYE